MVDILKRRSLKIIGIVLASLALPMHFLWKRLESTASQLSESERHEYFIQLSSQLIQQKINNSALSELYLSALCAKYSTAIVDSTLCNYASTLAKFDTLLIQQNQQSLFLKDIILLWYTGALDNKILSTESYGQSLAWLVLGTTPPGIRGSSFGNWSQPVNLNKD